MATVPECSGLGLAYPSQKGRDLALVRGRDPCPLIKILKSKLIASEGCIAWYVCLFHFEVPELIADCWDIVKKRYVLSDDLHNPDTD